MGDKIIEAREAHAAALDEFESAVEAVALAEGDDLPAAEERAAKAEAEVERRSAIIEKLEKVAEARKATPVIVPPAEKADERELPSVSVTRDEPVYRPDTRASFYRDLVYRNRDHEAMERITRHQAQMRDMSTSDTAGGDFVPPVYLGELYEEVRRNRRVVVNALPKLPLPPVGDTISIPAFTSGGSVAAQQEGNSVSETDLVSATTSVSVRTYAGQIDCSRQLLDRAEAGGQMIDTLIFRELTNAYDAALEADVINGTAAAYKHVGLLQLSNSASVTYTAGTATVAELYAKIVSAISTVTANFKEAPDAIIMHPRRAAWLAGNLSSTFPLFQVGDLNQAGGTAVNGLVGTISGIPVYSTPAMVTTAGTGTDEDRIIVANLASLPFMEGGLNTRVHEGVLSADLEVRLQVWAYSAFASTRYNVSNASPVAVISGTGLNDTL